MVPESSIFDLVIDKAHPGVVYAASYNSGIYRSLDDGLTWQVFNEGLTMRASLSLSLSADGSILYVATEGRVRSRKIEKSSKLKKPRQIN